jgi:hypothetical protein
MGVLLADGPPATPPPPKKRARPAPAKIWQRRFVKMLVVGDSGLGKTTLISSLLNTAQETVQVGRRCCCWGGRCLVGIGRKGPLLLV